MTACAHREWTKTRQSPLVCAACGVPWPGEQLPVPAHRAEGYGDLAKLPSWRSRVDAMTAELAADAATNAGEDA